MFGRPVLSSIARDGQRVLKDVRFEFGLQHPDPLPAASSRHWSKQRQDEGNITPLSEQKVNGQVLYGSIAVQDATQESFAREALMDLKRKFWDALTDEERIYYEYIINFANGTQNPLERYGKANIVMLLVTE